MPWRRSFAVASALLVLGLSPAAFAQVPHTGDVEGVLAEPGVLSRMVSFGNRLQGSTDGGDVKSGFYPELSNMVTGAGWISGGPGYRYWPFGDRLFIDGSAAVSWRSYKMAQARVEVANL